MTTQRFTPGSAAPPASHTTLQRNAIGTGDLVFFVVAAAAPPTVMAGAAPVAIAMAGRAAPARSARPPGRAAP
ncbi:hypothetical protein [Streptomyces sp. BP-8]|uniref:Uncharacterized protein n=1 Tax=Streptomyces sirii TaxID=3127701 RepID=A0ABZ2QGC5_9ACTN